MKSTDSEGVFSKKFRKYLIYSSHWVLAFATGRTMTNLCKYTNSNVGFSDLEFWLLCSKIITSAHRQINRHRTAPEIWLVLEVGFDPLDCFPCGENLFE